MDIDIDPVRLAAFRREVSSARSADEAAWEASRQLLGGAQRATTLHTLTQAIGTSSIPEDIKTCLLQALVQHRTEAADASSKDSLKQLTGLPPSKAIRALCVLFGVRPTRSPKWPTPMLAPASVESFLKTHPNPFDLLLESEPPSLLDLGAGDLSFADELVAHYAPEFARRNQPFILHCIDRLHPDSQLGGPLHADRLRLERLRSASGIRFRFYGNQDMFDLDGLERDERLAAKYTIVTCWAPATPTFAYEPTRLSTAIIDDELRRTKGQSRQVLHGKEPALEVIHAGRSLLFPPWKFEIRGPLALLELMARRAALCVLGAVDSQVFWELLSQLVDDPRARPENVILTDENLPTLLGDTFHRLMQLAPGATCLLSDLVPLRREFPSVLDNGCGRNTPYRFRSVRIRRGPQSETLPTSSTAKRFRDMPEETPPWFITLVPEILTG